MYVDSNYKNREEEKGGNGGIVRSYRLLDQSEFSVR